MVTTTINNKYVPCNLVLEKYMERADFKLLQKRSKLVQCVIQTKNNVHMSRKNLAHSHSDLILSTDILAAILRKNPTILTNTLRLQPSMWNFTKNNIQ